MSTYDQRNVASATEAPVTMLEGMKVMFDERVGLQPVRVVMAESPQEQPRDRGR